MKQYRFLQLNKTGFTLLIILTSAAVVKCDSYCNTGFVICPPYQTCLPDTCLKKLDDGQDMCPVGQLDCHPDSADRHMPRCIHNSCLSYLSSKLNNKKEEVVAPEDLEVANDQSERMTAHEMADKKEDHKMSEPEVRLLVKRELSDDGRCPDLQYFCHASEECISMDDPCDGEYYSAVGEQEGTTDYDDDRTDMWDTSTEWIPTTTGGACPDTMMLCPSTGSCVSSANECWLGREYVDLAEWRMRCSPGMFYCFTSFECMPETDHNCDHGADVVGVVDNSREQENATAACMVPAYYCFSSAACVDDGSCRHGSDNQLAFVNFTVYPPDRLCDAGQFYCFESMACVDSEYECGSHPDDGEDQFLSMWTECGTGWHYCFEAKTCLPNRHAGGHDGEDESFAEDHYSLRCGPNQIYCFERRQCVWQFELMEDDDEEDGEVGFYGEMTCPVGTVYCLETRTCAPSCGVLMTGYDDADEYEAEALGGSMWSADLGPPNTMVTCKPGQIYCVHLHACVSLAECGMSAPGGDDESHAEPIIAGNAFKCPLGEILVLGQGCRQVPHEDRELDGEGDVFHQWNGDDKADMTCPQGMTFCLAVRSCVNDCDFFGGNGGGDYDTDDFYHGELEDDSMPEAMPEPPCASLGQQSLICPENQTLCDERRICIPDGATCSTFNITSVPVCPLTLIWCGDRCAASCCPPRSEVPSAFFSTCMVSQHCLPTQSCCPDKHGFHQCMANRIWSGELANETLSPSGNLSLTTAVQIANRSSILRPSGGLNASSLIQELENSCLSLPDDLDNVQNCSTSPSSCPAASLCCDGSCRGLHILATAPVRIDEKCPSGQMHCPVTGICQSPLTWTPCGQPCGVGMVQCQEGPQVLCKKVEECSNTSAELRSVWMLPYPAVPGEDRPTLKLSHVWINFPTTTYSQQFRVLQVVAPSGSQWQYASENSDYFSIPANVNITGIHNIRLNANEGASSGVAYMDLDEGGIIRRLIGVILTELQPPIASVDLSSVRLEEDEVIRLRPGRVILPSEPEKNKQDIFVFQRVFRELMLTGGVAVLDHYKVYVSKLVTYLNKGTRDMGIMIFPTANITTYSDYTSHIFYKAHRRNKTEELNPMHPPILWLNNRPDIRIKPEENYYGKINITIVPVAQNWNGSIQYGKPLNISLKLTAVNDAPVALDGQNTSLSVPTVPVHKEDAGFLVSQLANLYYEDVETKALGIGILFGENSQHGKWQYSSGSGWTDLPAISPSPVNLPSSLLKDAPERGPIFISEAVKEYGCDRGKEEDSDTCWQSFMEADCGLRRRSHFGRRSFGGSSAFGGRFNRRHRQGGRRKISAFQDYVKKHTCDDMAGFTTPSTLDVITDDPFDEAMEPFFVDAPVAASGMGQGGPREKRQIFASISNMISNLFGSALASGPPAGDVEEQQSEDGSFVSSIFGQISRWPSGMSEGGANSPGGEMMFSRPTPSSGSSPPPRRPGSMFGSASGGSGMNGREMHSMGGGRDFSTEDNGGQGMEQSQHGVGTNSYGMDQPHGGQGRDGSFGADGMTKPHHGSGVTMSGGMGPQHGGTRGTPPPRPELAIAIETDRPTGRRESTREYVTEASGRLSPKPQGVQDDKEITSDECNKMTANKRKPLMKIEETEGRVFLLPHNYRLRFLPTSPGEVWKAKKVGELWFTAWDMTKGDAEDFLDFRLPYCCQCTLESSLSRDLARFHIQQTDCTGGPVVGQPKFTDECGVCAGDNSSCRDCKGVVNGGAVMDCGICYDSAEAASAARDCANDCGKNINIKTSKAVSTSEKLCVPASIAGNYTSCDGVVSSGAKENECGICWGGNTNLTEDTGKNECGECVGPNDLKECEDCRHRMDDCGTCQLPTSSTWNACNRKFAKISTNMFDLIQSSYLYLEFRHKEITKVSEEPNCSMTGKDSSVVSFEETVAHEGYISLSTRAPGVGRYKITCNVLTGKQKNLLTFETGENDRLVVVDSKLLKVTAVKPEKGNGRQWKLNLVVENIPTDINLDSLTCFYTKQSTKRGQLLPKAKLNKDLVECGEFLPMGGGVYFFGVTLVSSKLAIGNAHLSTVSSELTSSSPKPNSARLTKDFSAIEIEFDRNIESKSDCSGIFSENTTLLLNDSTCSTVANKLMVQLSTFHTLDINDVLVFREGNGIREMNSDPSMSEEVSGEISLETPKLNSQSKPKFDLLGPTVICPTGSVDIKIVNARNFKLGSSVLHFNLTQGIRQEDVNHLVTLSDRGSFIISASKMESDVRYVLSVKVESSFGFMSDLESLELIKDSRTTGLSVTLMGPLSIRPDAKLNLQAKVKPCEDRKSEAVMEYVWSMTGSSLDLSSKQAAHLALPGGSFQGGRVYNITVSVKIGSQTGSATRQLTVERAGPLAQIAGHKMVVGTASAMYIDASASRDRDNLEGDLQFDWSCLTLEGKACYNSTGVLRLEEVVERSVLQQPALVLPRESLVPGSYNFTVTVSKSELNSTDSIEVEVVLGQPPVIRTASPSGRISPVSGLLIKAEVSGPKDTCVQWQSVNEDGAVYMTDLELVSKSAKENCFHRDTELRDYPLVIPEAGDGFSGLKPGANYKFKLVAVHPKLGAADAIVSITTTSPPTGGRVMATPDEGVSMKVNFNMIANDFSDLDLPLSYKFGISTSDDRSKVKWLANTGSPSSETAAFLPPGGKDGLSVLVEVCDAYQACSTVIGQEKLNVTVKPLETSEVGSVVTSVADLIEQGSHAQAFIQFSLLLETIDANSSDESTMTTLCDYMFEEMLSVYVGTLGSDCSLVPTTVTILDIIMAAPCQLGLTSMQSIQQMSESVINCKKEAEEKSRNSDIVNSKSPFTLFSPSRRRKREVSQSSATEFSREWSDEQINTMVTMSMRMLELYGFDGNYSSINATNVREVSSAAQDTINKINRVYMPDMCQGATINSEYKSIHTPGLNFTVVKTDLQKGITQRYYFVYDPNTEIGASSSIRLNDFLDKRFSQWNCGKKSLNGTEIPCVGVCIGSSVYKFDLATASKSDLINQQPPKLISKIHDVRLLNPVTGVDLTAMMINQSKTEDWPYLFTLEIAIPKIPTEEIQCGHFLDTWTYKYCNITGYTQFSSTSPVMVNIDSKLPGFVALLCKQAPVTTPPDTDATNATSTPKPPPTRPVVETPTFKFEKYVQLTIYEDFDRMTKFGTKRSEFVAHLRNQFAWYFGTSRDNIRNLVIWRGSVEVAFNLVAPSNMEAGEMQIAYDKFSDMLANGELELQDLDSNSMNVPRQCIEEPCYSEMQVDETIKFIVAACTILLVLLVLIFIIVAVCTKKKNTKKRMVAVTIFNQQPTYRTFHYADSLEGTRASLNKVKRSYSDMPEYMPSNFNSREQTANSILLTDEEDPRQNNRPVFRDQYGVPYAAMYLEPTQEMISMTRVPQKFITPSPQRRRY